MSAEQRPGPVSATFAVVVAFSTFVVGLGLGAWSIWLVPSRILGGVEGLSIVITVVGIVAVGLLAGWGLRTWWAPVWPILGWLIPTGLFSAVVGPGGDIVVPGALPYAPGVVRVGEFDLAAGFIAAVIVVVLSARLYAGMGRSGRGFTQRPEQPTQPG